MSRRQPQQHPEDEWSRRAYLQFHGQFIAEPTVPWVLTEKDRVFLLTNRISAE